MNLYGGLRPAPANCKDADNMLQTWGPAEDLLPRQMNVLDDYSWWLMSSDRHDGAVIVLNDLLII